MSNHEGRFDILNSDKPPPEMQIYEYQQYLEEIGWKEEDVKKCWESRAKDDSKAKPGGKDDADWDI